MILSVCCFARAVLVCCLALSNCACQLRYYRDRFDHPERVGFYMDDQDGEPDIIDVMKENVYLFDVNNKLANE